VGEKYSDKFRLEFDFHVIPETQNIYRRKINKKINVFVLDINACDLILIKVVCIKSVSFHAYHLSSFLHRNSTLAKNVEILVGTADVCCM
jgi:hypothetical protein